MSEVFCDLQIAEPNTNIGYGIVVERLARFSFRLEFFVFVFLEEMHFNCCSSPLTPHPFLIGLRHLKKRQGEGDLSHYSRAAPTL